MDDTAADPPPPAPAHRRGRTPDAGAPAAEPESAPHPHPHHHGHHARRTAHRHKAAVAHHTPGRVRLKIPQARDNPALLMQIQEAYAKVPGIEAIEIRPSSGSLVLYYDKDHETDIPSFFRPLPPAPEPEKPQHHHASKTHLDETLSSIEEEAEFLAEHSEFAKVIVTYCKDLDRKLKRVSGNNLDLKILIPIGLAAVTFLEIGAAAATPMWVTLVIFSLNHFVELHAHDADNEQS